MNIPEKVIENIFELGLDPHIPAILQILNSLGIIEQQEQEAAIKKLYDLLKG